MGLTSTQKVRSKARIQTQNLSKTSISHEFPVPLPFFIACTSTHVPRPGSLSWVGAWTMQCWSPALAEALAGEGTARDSSSFLGLHSESRDPTSPCKADAARPREAKALPAVTQTPSRLGIPPLTHPRPCSRSAPWHPTKDFKHPDSPSLPIPAPTAWRTHHLSPLHPEVRPLPLEESRSHGLCRWCCRGSREVKTGQPHTWPALACPGPGPALQLWAVGFPSGQVLGAATGPAASTLLPVAWLALNKQGCVATAAPCVGEREPGDLSPQPCFLQGLPGAGHSQVASLSCGAAWESAW